MFQDDIRKESNTFGDLIVENFTDSYHNLTLKSLMMLKWAKNNCPATPYVLKVDDDVYVNVRNLAAFVKHPAVVRSPNILVGYLLCRKEPIRETSKIKWLVDPYITLFNTIVIAHAIS